jgi:hypothetical protein
VELYSEHYVHEVLFKLSILKERIVHHSITPLNC